MNTYKQFLKYTCQALLISLCFFQLPANAQSSGPIAGKEYIKLNPAQPTDSGQKIELLEFFWYGCPHCEHLQAPLNVWLKKLPPDVVLKHTPAVFDDSWLPLTRAYYTIETMGLVDKLHGEFFNAIHKQNQRLKDAATIIDWAASKGVDRKTFSDTYNSFGINGRTQRSVELTRKFDVTGTPSIAIDGKYLTAPSMTLRADRSVDYDRFFKVIDALIIEARKTKSPTKAGK